MIKLDYTLKTVEERIALVNKFLEENPNPGPIYLEALADYVVLFAAKLEAKQQRKQQREIITESRLATIKKRETSFEGLAAQFENGEDGIYNLINEDKNTLLDKKAVITKKDVETMPELRQIRESIAVWKNILSTAKGKDAYIAKSAIIDLQRDQYLVKESYQKPVMFQTITISKFPTLLNESYEFKDFAQFESTGISLTDPKVISAILCNYSRLKEHCYGKFNSDLWCLMQDFDEVVDEALREYPLYERIVEYKIDAKQNFEIQQLLEQEFGTTHSPEYISSLWRNKIPEVIAAGAKNIFLNWHYTKKDPKSAKWKTCSRCGQTKLASNIYFSKNRTSKDGFYSICKECRNKKYKEGKG